MVEDGNTTAAKNCDMEVWRKLTLWPLRFIAKEVVGAGAHRNGMPPMMGLRQKWNCTLLENVGIPIERG